MSMFKRIVAEPLVQFLGIAALLSAAYAAFSVVHHKGKIEISRNLADQLSEAYRLQYGSSPSADTREALVRQYVDDEILYREAQALGLDKDDEIVRRRLIQKMRFVTEDLGAPAEPTRSQLENFYRLHSKRYVEPSNASFSHIFFSLDSRSVSAARERAGQVIRQLGGKTPIRASDLGDPFPDNYDFSGYDLQQVERLFGNTDFSKAVFQQPVGKWTGPFRSAYGWHLLRVNGRSATAPLPFATIIDRVRADYLEQIQVETNKAAFTALKSRYVVIRNDRVPVQ